MISDIGNSKALCITHDIYAICRKAGDAVFILQRICGNIGLAIQKICGWSRISGPSDFSSHSNYVGVPEILDKVVCITHDFYASCRKAGDAVFILQRIV
jgi:hypothetical protein